MPKISEYPTYIMYLRKLNTFLNKTMRTIHTAMKHLKLINTVLYQKTRSAVLNKAAEIRSQKIYSEILLCVSYYGFSYH